MVFPLFAQGFPCTSLGGGQLKLFCQSEALRTFVTFSIKIHVLQYG